MNPNGQNTLKAWFFDVGYLCLLVISLVVIGFAVKSLGPTSSSVASASLNQEDYDVAVLQHR